MNNNYQDNIAKRIIYSSNCYACLEIHQIHLLYQGDSFKYYCFKNNLIKCII